MKLDDLLNAAVQLEKRIETDRMLRACFSAIWNDSDTGKKRDAAKAPTAAGKSGRAVTLTFPAEFCELLEKTARSSGKSPAQLLEESFAEYYLKHFAK